MPCNAKRARLCVLAELSERDSLQPVVVSTARRRCHGTRRVAQRLERLGVLAQPRTRAQPQQRL